LRGTSSTITSAIRKPRGQEEIRGFLDGVEVVPPGVVAVRIWNGDGPALDVQAPTAAFIGRVARKP
jgi:S-adenosyl methyltransferase